MKRYGTVCWIRQSYGFSLIEVVVATAVFATAIVAIIGLMSPLSHRVEDVLDSEVASSLAEGIQAELTQIGWGEATQPWFLDRLDPAATEPIQLVATSAGDRVRLRLSSAGVPPADRDLNDESEPGIADRDRYFLITLSRLPNFDPNLSGSLPLQAIVEWPFQLPEGPASGTESAHGDGADPFVLAAATRRERLSYFFAIVP